MFSVLKPLALFVGCSALLLHVDCEAAKFGGGRSVSIRSYRPSSIKPSASPTLKPKPIKSAGLSGISVKRGAGLPSTPIQARGSGISPTTAIQPSWRAKGKVGSLFDKKRTASNSSLNKPLATSTQASPRYQHGGFGQALLLYWLLTPQTSHATSSVSPDLAVTSTAAFSASDLLRSDVAINPFLGQCYAPCDSNGCEQIAQRSPQLQDDFDGNASVSW